MDQSGRIQSRLNAVMERITKAAVRSGRDPGTIALVTVGKTQSVETIGHAISAGARIIGENYIQEAREKWDALFHRQVQWHYIGHLQSNKAKFAVRLFDLIHSADSLKLIAELNKQAAKIGKIQDILIQVNLSGEATKSGTNEAGAVDLIGHLKQFENIRPLGLMTMPPFFNAPEKARPFFAALRHLRDKIAGTENLALPHLSMGMTGDFEVAVEEGATLVRVGTAIFGDRR